ncbi:MAG: hypothetical protein K0R57_2154 [Paenibacillaceae bacterium]|jgi:hypothetical protein|nr:hypothetical protein [Paenibacillaceae bacterium]
MTTNPIPVGVIRWDYLHGGDKHTNCELKSLSPREYHSQVPFFLRIEDEETVSGHENTQEAIDRQIRYAEQAGIDYWAFISGTEEDPEGPENYAMHKYLASGARTSLRFCLVLHKHDKDVWERRIERLAGLMAQPSYMTAEGGRPLVYVFSIADMEQAYGAGAGTREALSLIRVKAAAAGLPDPCLVLMCSCARVAHDSGMAAQYGFDAISAYSYAGKGPDSLELLPYGDLACQNRESWNEYLAANLPYIPLVSFGRNEKPRLLNPPPWGGGHGPYWANPAPEEAAEQLGAGIRFVRAHKDLCRNGVLCYAWNEYAEGGWICPTYGEGSAKLEALGKVIREAAQ